MIVRLKYQKVREFFDFRDKNVGKKVSKLVSI